MTKIFKMAELFCGPGGLALGAIKASTRMGGWEIKPVWANDIDPDTCKTYSENIHYGKKSNVYCSPVEKLDFKELPNIDALTQPPKVGPFYKLGYGLWTPQSYWSYSKRDYNRVFEIFL